MNENKNLEYALGKGLMQPFANTNSGSRKLMYNTHVDQALRLLKPENPIIQTGYEIRFGDLSSSIIKAESDFEVVAKIEKFPSLPNHHYLLIVRRHDNDAFDVIERKDYNHITETYGYLYNNKMLDNLDIGYEVPRGDILRTSSATDEYMNHCDGVNLLTGYISSDKDLEDGIIISEDAAVKLASPLIKKVTIFIGENDILLNLYNGKSFPDIGETVQNGILCAIRKEKIEECLFMQSADRLSQILMSDEKFTVDGQIIDINIYSNNPEMLVDRFTNAQPLKYYNNHKRYITEIVNIIDSFRDDSGNINMSYDLQKIYYTSLNELNGMLFEKDKKYDGTIIEMYLLENNIPSVGDKITNRYGGKGVISKIVPTSEMPLLDNGTRLEAYFNSCTCVNRLNPGQLHEMSLTFIGSRIIEYISNNIISTRDAIDMICKFISMVAPKEAETMYDMLYHPDNTEEDREWFIDQILNDGYILLSIKPISESMTLDKLNDIYKEFPFIKQYRVLSKMIDSSGNERYIPGRRTLVAGHIYIYRLKQYAEDKFSVTSLSSTNLTNENTKSKASKNYMATHMNTPIRFGEMETEDERHLGTQIIVENLMIHSTSPQARRLTESFLEENPYIVDIKLDGTCKNRSAEKAKVYLKTMGYRIRFIKVKKKKKRVFSSTVTPLPFPNETFKLFTHVDPNQYHKSGEELLKELKEIERHRNKRLFRRRLFTPIDLKIEDLERMKYGE